MKQDGMISCPICKGKGHITENAEVYSFISRDPDTHMCLTCMGKGRVGPRKKLPDGRGVYELTATHAKKTCALQASARTMGGADGDGALQASARTMEPQFLEMALNPRLNKVLAGGKKFLIVTETEPYYFAVYRIIREQEKSQGTWTDEDEAAYLDASLESYPKDSNARFDRELNLSMVKMETMLLDMIRPNIGEYIDIIDVLESNPLVRDKLLNAKILITVAEYEPDFFDHLRLTREYMSAEGSWTREAEEDYVRRMEQEYDKMKAQRKYVEGFIKKEEKR